MSTHASGRSIVMHTGYEPPPRAAFVLLSGLDSAAAMHWARARYAPVFAVGFDYGQPGAEIAAAQVIAERRGVEWIRRSIIDIGSRSPDAGRDEHGVSRAFVHMRNLIMIAHAANAAARRIPGGRAAIVVGCNVDDMVAFPDCRPPFMRCASDAVFSASQGDILVDAPWLDGLRKAEIVRWAAGHEDPAVLEDVRYAVSCYRGTRCGACDACTLRASAFAEAGVEDGSEPPPRVHGGDPAREPRSAA